MKPLHLLRLLDQLLDDARADSHHAGENLLHRLRRVREVVHIVVPSARLVQRLDDKARMRRGELLKLCPVRLARHLDAGALVIRLELAVRLILVAEQPLGVTLRRDAVADRKELRLGHILPPLLLGAVCKIEHKILVIRASIRIIAGKQLFFQPFDERLVRLLLRRHILPEHGVQLVRILLLKRHRQILCLGERHRGRPVPARLIVNPLFDRFPHG